MFFKKKAKKKSSPNGELFAENAGLEPARHIAVSWQFSKLLPSPTWVILQCSRPKGSRSPILGFGDQNSQPLNYRPIWSLVLESNQPCRFCRPVLKPLGQPDI